MSDISIETKRYVVNICCCIFHYFHYNAVNCFFFKFYFLYLERHVKPEEIGLEDPKGASPEGKQPFVVAFFKNGSKLVNPDASARRKREARRSRNYGHSENYLRNPLTGEARVL